MFEVLGLVLSFVGLISIVPQVLSFLSSSLPEGRLKQLDETLKETVELLEAAIQDGLLYNSNFTSRTWSSLHRLRDVTENLRANVLSAPGFYNQCIASFNGLSFRIGETLQSVKVIRARIVSVSDEARQKLLRDSRVHQLSRSGDLEGVTIPSDPSPIPNSGNREIGTSGPNRPPFVPPATPEISLPTPAYSTREDSILHRPLRHSSLTQPAYAAESRSTTRRASRILSLFPDQPLVNTPLPANSSIANTADPFCDNSLSASSTEGSTGPNPLYVPTSDSSSGYQDVLRLAQRQNQATQKLIMDVDRLMGLVGTLLARTSSPDLEGQQHFKP